MNSLCRLLFTFFLLATGSAAAAQDGDGDWHFIVAPYLLAPSLTGDITVRGREAEADIGPGDVFSNLNLGFMGYMEANNGRWGVGTDIIYSDVDVTDDARIAEVDSTQAVITAVVYYRVAPTVELYGGARYNKVGVDLDFQGPLGLESLSADRSWIDPVVGARFATPIGDRWNFMIAADAGGFGLGSDIALNLWPVVTYEFSDSLSGALGYRLLFTDYDSGSGNRLFEYDILTAGPVAGLMLRF